MKQPILLSLVLAVIGLGIGYSLRSATHSGEKTGNAEGFADTESASSSGSRRETAHTSAVRRGLAQSQGREHWLEWIAGVENASLDDLPRLARMVDGNEGILQIIDFRWVELDPDHFYQTLLKESKFLTDRDGESTFPYDELAEFLFREWPKKHLEAAIAALSGHRKLLNQHTLRHQLANFALESDPRRGLALSKQWRIQFHGTNSEGFMKWARNDPRAAIEAIFSEDIGGTGTGNAIASVAKVWAEDDPETALVYSESLNGPLGSKLRDEMFDVWTKMDLKAASEWLSAQEDLKLQDALRPTVIKQWAKDDPQAALEWTKENLEGRYRADAVAELVRGVVTSDKKLAGDLVMQLEPGPGRDRAAKIVAVEWFTRSLNNSAKSHTNPEAIAWLKDLDDPKAQMAALGEISSRWAKDDPEGIKRFLETAEGTLGSARVIASIARRVFYNDREGTMNWAEGLGPDRSPQVSRAVFSSWVNNQPEMATDWFKELPRDDPRHAPILDEYFSVVNHLPEATAIERLRALPPEDRAQLREAGLPKAKVKRLLQAAGGK